METMKRELKDAFRILHQEGSAQLAEFSELNFSAAVFINLLEEILEFLLCGSESHGTHDLSQVIGRQELLLLHVKKIKTNLETLDFISGETSGIVDLLEVNVGIGIGLGHA